MIGTFHELVIGGVLFAPFLTYAFAALVLFLLLRPVLRLIGFENAFSNPPVALLCVYVCLLAVLIVLF